MSTSLSHYLPITHGMLRSIVDTLPLPLQKLLSKYLWELISSLLHEHQVAIYQIYVTNQFFKEMLLNKVMLTEWVILTFLFTILTMSWSKSRSATCIWIKSPQFFTIVSNSFNMLNKWKRITTNFMVYYFCIRIFYTPD